MFLWNTESESQIRRTEKLKKKVYVNEWLAQLILHRGDRLQGMEGGDQPGHRLDKLGQAEQGEVRGAVADGKPTPSPRGRPGVPNPTQIPTRTKAAFPNFSREAGSLKFLDI